MAGLMPSYFLCPFSPWAAGFPQLERADTAKRFTDFTVAKLLDLDRTDQQNHYLQQDYNFKAEDELSPGGGKIDRRRLRKSRTIFDTVQIETLETVFARQQYLNAVERQHLAAQLGLDEAQIKVWFQNRRSKSRKNQACERALPEYHASRGRNTAASSSTSLTHCGTLDRANQAPRFTTEC